MGIKYNLRCPNCDYEVSIAEGIGMFYSPYEVFQPDNLESFVEDSIVLREALDFLEQGAHHEDYGQSPYYCPECYNLYQRFHFRLRNEDKTYSPRYRCPDCDRRLNRARLRDKDGEVTILRLNGKDADWRCPRCGNGKLTDSGGMILWD